MNEPVKGTCQWMSGAKCINGVIPHERTDHCLGWTPLTAAPTADIYCAKCDDIHEPGEECTPPGNQDRRNMQDRQRAIHILSELALPLDEGRIQMLVDIFRVWRTAPTITFNTEEQLWPTGSTEPAANTTTSTTEADVPRLYDPAKAQGSLRDGNVGAELESRQAAQVVGGGMKLSRVDELELEVESLRKLLTAAPTAPVLRCMDKLEEDGSTFRCTLAQGHEGRPHECGDWEWWSPIGIDLGSKAAAPTGSTEPQKEDKCPQCGSADPSVYPDRYPWRKCVPEDHHKWHDVRTPLTAAPTAPQ